MTTIQKNDVYNNKKAEIVVQNNPTHGYTIH